MPRPSTPVQYKIMRQQVWLHPECRDAYIKSQEQREVVDMGIPEAPNDGKMYVRQSEQWVELPPSSSFPDAPNDSEMYVRQNQQWVKLPSGFSTKFEYTFSSSLGAGPANSQVRFDSAVADQVSMVRVSNNDYDGVDESNLLKLIEPGFIIFVQDKNDPNIALKFIATGPVVNTGTDCEIPVTLEAGVNIPSDNQRVMIVVYGGG